MEGLLRLGEEELLDRFRLELEGLLMLDKAEAAELSEKQLETELSEEVELLE